MKNLNAFEQFVNELSTAVAEEAIKKFRLSLNGLLKETFKPCWSEPEAAALLGISAETLARRRKEGEIDFSYSILPGKKGSGKIVYMQHHLLDYLLRNERRQGGKQLVTLHDILGRSAD